MAGVLRLCDELGLRGTVCLRPAIPHAEMPFGYHAVRVCVCPRKRQRSAERIRSLGARYPGIVSELSWVSEPIYRDARLTVVPVGSAEALAGAIIWSQLDRKHLFKRVEADYQRLVEA